MNTAHVRGQQLLDFGCRCGGAGWDGCEVVAASGLYRLTCELLGVDLSEDLPSELLDLVARIDRQITADLAPASWFARRQIRARWSESLRPLRDAITATRFAGVALTVAWPRVRPALVAAMQTDAYLTHTPITRTALTQGASK